MPQARPEPTRSPVALFVFSNLREQKGGLTRAWLRRLALFHEAGWETHVATIHRQPEIDDTLTAWRERGWLPAETQVHHYQRRSRRFRPSWTRPTDETFTRDDRVADWLDWLVGLLPGVVVFADSPVTYAPVAMMRNPYVGRIMTVHLAHRSQARRGRRRPPAPVRSRYQGPAGQPKLTGRFLPYAGEADAVVALTHRQAEHLAEDLPGLPVHVIPNIVDAPTEQLAGLPRDPTRVVSVGRLDPLKRIDEAMRAVAQARSRIPGLHLSVFGRGPDLDRLIALRDELELDDVVSFPGFSEHPYRELAQARASIMTSRREGFGLAVAESLAVGTPVVTFDVDYGPAELVTDRGNGRLVPDGATEELADALVDVMGDDEQWASLSAAGPPAVAHLTQDRVAVAWLDLATKVASEIPRPEPGLLVEDLRARRRGLQILGVRFADGSSTPQSVRAAGVAVPLAAIGTDAAEPEPGPGVAIESALSAFGVDSGLVVTSVTATLPWADITRLATVEPAGARPNTAHLLLSVQDGSGATLPVVGPGVPPTVLPTDGGVLVAAPDDEGRLTVERAGGVLELQVTPARVEADLDGQVTVLSDVLLFEGMLDRSPTELTLRCVVPGLGLAPDARLALIARAGDPIVLGEVELITTDAPADPAAHWSGSVTLDWDAQALTDPTLTVPARLDLGVATGRAIRSVGSLAGGDRPVPMRAGGSRWVMATSSNGRLLLLRGRAIRARVRSALRRTLPRRIRI